MSKKIKVDDLTLKQIREIQGLDFGISLEANKKQSSLFSDYIGEYVIVRSRNEGINAGYVKALDDTGIVLTEARRLYYHKPLDKNMSWYEGVATVGCSSDTKISNAVKEKIIVEDYSITVCSKEAEEVIKNATTNKQN